MRVIVCGSRDWFDGEAIGTIIAGLMRFKPLTIVHGDCRGADKMADVICRGWGLVPESHPADWNGLGKRAGYVRNKLMADLGADRVVAFKDHFDHTLQTGGTENMISLARMAGIPTLVVSHS